MTAILPFISPFKLILLDYSYFTMLCQFLLYSKVDQLHIHIQPLFFGFPSQSLREHLRRELSTKQRSLLSYSCLSSLSFSLFSPFPPQRWNRNLKKKVSFQCSIGKIHVGQDALFNISFNLVKQSPVSLSTRNFSEGCGQTEKSMSLRMDLGDFSSPWIYLRH